MTEIMGGISASFTCVSCRVAFKEADMQRLHYKSDWHRYNLKRKVAELPPVSSEQFELKVLNQRHANAVQEQEQHVYCKCCKKSFNSDNAYTNHLNSKKHQEMEKNYVPVEPKSEPNQIKNILTEKVSNVGGENEEMELDSVTEELDSDEWSDLDNPIDNNDCLFCSHHSKNFLSNLEHMTLAHSFFVPDIEYCTHLEGLLHYLGEKVSEGFMCLWCNEKGKTFHSADAAKKHMVDKGHCKMIHEGVALAEYADFYDYSTSYPDAETANIDNEVEVPEIDGSDYQMVLPSGVTIGHRSLMRYYKQSHDPSKAVVVSSKNTKKLHKVLATYRALGWSETQQEAAAKRARDIHYMKRLHSKYTMKLGLKGNKLLQPHFRQQVNF